MNIVSFLEKDVKEIIPKTVYAVIVFIIIAFSLTRFTTAVKESSDFVSCNSEIISALEMGVDPNQPYIHDLCGVKG